MCGENQGREGEGGLIWLLQFEAMTPHLGPVTARAAIQSKEGKGRRGSTGEGNQTGSVSVDNHAPQAGHSRHSLPPQCLGVMCCAVLAGTPPSLICSRTLPTWKEDAQACSRCQQQCCGEAIVRQQAAVTCLLGCSATPAHDTSRFFAAVTAQNTVCPCLPAPMFVWSGLCNSAPASREELNHPPLHNQPMLCRLLRRTYSPLALEQTPNTTSWRLQRCSSRQSAPPTQPVCNHNCDLPPTWWHLFILAQRRSMVMSPMHTIALRSGLVLPTCSNSHTSTPHRETFASCPSFCMQ